MNSQENLRKTRTTDNQTNEVESNILKIKVQEKLLDDQESPTVKSIYY